MDQTELQFIAGQGRFVIVESWTKPQPKTVLPRFRVQIGQRGRDYSYRFEMHVGYWGTMTQFHRRCASVRWAGLRAFGRMKRCLTRNGTKRDVKALRAWFEKEVL